MRKPEDDQNSKWESGHRIKRSLEGIPATGGRPSTYPESTEEANAIRKGIWVCSVLLTTGLRRVEALLEQKYSYCNVKHPARQAFSSRKKPPEEISGT